MKKPLLSSLEIDSPCPIELKKLDPEVRTWYCRECKLNVHNVSNMTAKEAEAFLRNRTGRVCVSIKRRADGCIYTDNCPRILRAARRRVIKLATIIGITTFIQWIGRAAVAQGLVGAPVDPSIGQGGCCGPEEPDLTPRLTQSLGWAMFWLSCLPATIVLIRSMCHQVVRASTPMQLARCILGFLIVAGFAVVVFSAEFSLSGESLSWSSFWSHTLVALMVASIILCFITLWKLAKVATSILAFSILLNPGLDLIRGYSYGFPVFLIFCGISLFAWTRIFTKKDVQKYFMKASLNTSMSMAFGPIMLIYLTVQIRYSSPMFQSFQIAMLDALRTIIPN
jgi:hypothetical protein